MSQRSLEEFGAYRKEVVLQRAALADEIIGILTRTIERLRAEPGPAQARGVREEVADYGQ